MQWLESPPFSLTVQSFQFFSLTFHFLSQMDEKKKKKSSWANFLGERDLQLS
jgi:hypothetical protein